MRDKDGRLVWIDLEMTGLDSQRDSIIEIATIVTTADLEVVEEGPVLAIHQPDHVLDGMDEWNTRHHNASGLVGPGSGQPHRCGRGRACDAGVSDQSPRREQLADVWQ